MLEIEILFNLSIKDCMYITYANWKLRRMLHYKKIGSSCTYLRPWGSLTIGVGWSSTSFLSIISSFISNLKWTSLLPAKYTKYHIPPITPWLKIKPRLWNWSQQVQSINWLQDSRDSYPIIWIINNCCSHIPNSEYKPTLERSLCTPNP